jgi:hypothetical protein
MCYKLYSKRFSNFRFGFFEVLKPLVAAVLTAEYVNLQDLRDIRRMNPPLQHIAKAKAEIAANVCFY